MKKTIAGITAAFIVCFVFTAFAVSCENLFDQNDTDTTQHDEGQDETEDEEKVDNILSPGTALPVGSLVDKIAAIAERTDRNVYYDIVVD
jgi:hypothetical protein